MRSQVLSLKKHLKNRSSQYVLGFFVIFTRNSTEAVKENMKLYFKI